MTALVAVDRAAGELGGGRVHDLEVGDGGLAQAADLLKPPDGCRDHLGQGAEFFEQLLCQRLHVAPRYGAKQDQLEHFVIVQRIAAGLQESFAQALAMA